MGERSGEHGSNKKSRLALPNDRLAVQVKQETPERGTGRAIVVAVAATAVAAAAPQVAMVAVEFDKHLLDCPLCYLPLKPPVFQCRAKHTACGLCVANGNNKCAMCGGAYERSDELDRYLLGAKVRCPNEAQGCRTSVAYCLAGDHQQVCPYEPCRCPEPGCVFLGSPPALRDHLASHHAWVVTTVPLGKSRVIEMQAADRRRLVTTEDGEHVFLLVVSESEGRGGGRQVRLVRVRAGEDGGPTGLWCMLWLISPVDQESGGKTPAQMLEERARFCAVLTEEAAMEVGGRYLPVQPYDMHPEGCLVLRLRIDKYELKKAEGVVVAYPVPA